MNHTPGPWEVANDWVDLNKHAIKRPNMGHIMIISHVGFLESPVAVAEQEANARLIAAAPELFAALKTVAKTIDLYAIHGKIAKQVDTALAKARGRTEGVV